MDPAKIALHSLDNSGFPLKRSEHYYYYLTLNTVELNC